MRNLTNVWVYLLKFYCTLTLLKLVSIDKVQPVLIEHTLRTTVTDM